MAAGISLLGLLLRQPLIVSFIAVGLLCGAAAEERTDIPTIVTEDKQAP